ncbi:MAG: phosphoglucosamine mutase [Brevinematia bacterium]
MPLKFTVSGLRGIWNDGITPDVVSEYTRAFLSYLKSKGSCKKISLGRDTRKTSPVISDIVSGIVRSCGVDVLDMEIVTTPMALFVTRIFQLDGGIIVTASHNPPEWNALKFVDKDGVFVSQEGIDFISKLEKHSFSDWMSVGSVEKISLDDVLKLFLDKLKSVIDISVIKNRRFRVAFDPVNGAGYLLGKKFLEMFGCEVVSINDDPGKFPQRETEPVPNALKQLSAVVLEKKCDVGFALDPDGDRLALVLDNGVAPGEEYTLPLAELSAIKYVNRTSEKNTIVINFSTSSLSEYIAREFGFEVVRSKVGEVNVVDKLREVGGFIGGEGNGGVIFPSVNLARDSFVGIALILYLMAKEKLKLSEIISGLPKLEMVKLKTSRVIEDKEIGEIVSDLEKMFSLVEESDEDGRWFRFSNGWLHVRLSNTEPVTRVIFEGDREFTEIVTKIVNKFCK